MTAERLALEDFRPRQALRVPASRVDRPRFPVVDAHAHLGPEFGGEWARRPVEELLAVLDEAGVTTLFDFDGGWGETLRDRVARYAPHPGRFVTIANLDYASWAEDRRFGETEAARLRDAVRAGARGLKAWKPLGLTARDPAGRIVPVDDPRLDPLWATAAELATPVAIHVADPIAFFEPLDRFNERWEELHAHPDWHFWPPRTPSDPDAAGFPTFDELMAQLEALVARHPATTFVGAHVGCAAEDLVFVSRMLATYPNWNVDIAARISELGRQPFSARGLFVRFPDRIVFGTDLPAGVDMYRLHYRFLETRDESFAYGIEEVPVRGRWAIHGLGLPDDVLAAVYADNARRLYGLPAADDAAAASQARLPGTPA